MRIHKIIFVMILKKYICALLKQGI